LILTIAFAGLGAVRTHGAQLDHGRAQQVRAGCAVVGVSPPLRIMRKHTTCSGRCWCWPRIHVATAIQTSYALAWEVSPVAVARNVHPTRQQTALQRRVVAGDLSGSMLLPLPIALSMNLFLRLVARDALRPAPAR
jgi:hypothetical protein